MQGEAFYRAASLSQVRFSLNYRWRCIEANLKVKRITKWKELSSQLIIIQPVNHKTTYKLSSFISSGSSVKLLITSVIWPCKPVYFLPTTWRLNRVFYSFPSCSCSSLIFLREFPHWAVLAPSSYNRFSFSPPSFTVRLSADCLKHRYKKTEQKLNKQSNKHEDC